jgi:hypothetical protein
MWYWLWGPYLFVSPWICFIARGFEGAPRYEGDSKIFRFMDRRCEDSNNWSSTVGKLLYHSGNTDFHRLFIDIDDSWKDHLSYMWENMTVFVPTPECPEWQDLRLLEEFRERGCNYTNSKRLCPDIRRFIQNHIVDRSLQEGRKAKTKAGNKIWWSKIGEDQFVHPGAVTIMKRTEALNGEVIVIDKLLWSPLSKKEQKGAKISQ